MLLPYGFRYRGVPLYHSIAILSVETLIGQCVAYNNKLCQATPPFVYLSLHHITVHYFLPFLHTVHTCNQGPRNEAMSHLQYYGLIPRPNCLWSEKGNLQKMWLGEQD